MRHRIYLAGTLRSAEAFRAAAARWSSEGWFVQSAYGAFLEGLGGAQITETTWKHFAPGGDFYSAYIRNCAMLIADSDAIGLVSGWRDSADAMRDLQIARLLGLDTYDATTQLKLSNL